MADINRTNTPAITAAISELHGAGAILGFDPEAAPLVRALLVASLGPTPEEPEHVGSWLPDLDEVHFACVLQALGDDGITPVMADMSDAGRRMVLQALAWFLHPLDPAEILHSALAAARGTPENRDHPPALG